MRCMVCFNEVPEGEDVCPCCGFTQYNIIGDTKEALLILNSMAEKHRKVFLKKYDFGVNIFTWKDNDGSIVLNEKKRVSFGTGDQLYGNALWLDQKFARIPDVKEQIVELSVIKDGTLYKEIPVSIPALKESQLQKLGIEMQEDLALRLILKNDSSSEKSESVKVL